MTIPLASLKIQMEKGGSNGSWAAVHLVPHATDGDKFLFDTLKIFKLFSVSTSFINLNHFNNSLNLGVSLFLITESTGFSGRCARFPLRPRGLPTLPAAAASRALYKVVVAWNEGRWLTRWSTQPKFWRTDSRMNTLSKSPDCWYVNWSYMVFGAKLHTTKWEPLLHPFHLWPLFYINCDHLQPSAMAQLHDKSMQAQMSSDKGKGCSLGGPQNASLQEDCPSDQRRSISQPQGRVEDSYSILGFTGFEILDDFGGSLSKPCGIPPTYSHFYGKSWPVDDWALICLN